MKALVKILIVLFFLCAALFFSVRTLAAEGGAVITLWDGDEVYATVVAEGGVAKPPVPPKREGYRFLGWRVDSREGEAFEWGGTVNDSISLYSSYELLPPTYEIDDISFVYDGSCRTLGFKSLTHPLLSSGIISYEWYKDGSPLGFVGSSMSIKNVSDSGRYSCKVTFTHSAYTVSITTPEVYVEVKQGVVDLPSVKAQ